MTLMERDEQLRAAAGYLEEASAGHGRVIFVAGEAGIGKTSYVTRVLTDARGSARVVVGGCDGAGTPAPLGPLVEMLPALPDDVWPPGATRQEVFAHVLSALRDPPGHRPYLLVIEDAHWADEATLDLVRHLARRIHDCRSLLLVTYRPEDSATAGLRLLLGETASAPGTRRIDLPALSRTAVEALAEHHSAAHPGAPEVDAARLYEVTGGNAFFVTEALSADTDEVPVTARDAVLARVERLGAPSRRALEVVAMAGTRPRVELVAELLAGGLDAIDEPVRSGLLRQVDDDVTFRHELARLAVLGEIPVGRAVHLHRRLLAALEPRGADPAVLAHHADGGRLADAVLRHAPVAAARAGQLGAHREALWQYRRALGYADRLADPARAELHWSMGYECYLTERIDEAMEHTRQALEIWEAAGEAVRVGDAWRCLSRLSWFAGRGEDAERQADIAIDLLDGSPSVELAMAYSNRAQLRMLASDLDGTRTWGRRTLEVLERVPVGARQEEVRVHALNNLGTMEVTAGDLGTGEGMLLESLEGARTAGLHEHAARAYCNLASAAVVQRRHADARRYLDEGIEYCVDRDLDSWTAYLEGVLCRFLLDRGEAAAARARAEALLEREDLAAIDAIEPEIVLAHAHARRGDPRAAGHLARAHTLAAGMGEVQRVAPAAAARSEAAWIAGDAAGSAAAAEEAWPAALGADCPWNRGSVATWLPPDVEVDSSLLAPPFAAEREGRWEEAAALWERLGCPFERALALARGGGRTGLTDAVRGFDRLAATAAAARTRAMLRAEGWPAPRPPRGVPHAHGLTAREVEVLALVREGLTDAGVAARLQISRRTAEHHVASILAKVGAGSRRELAGVGSGGLQDG